MSRPLVAKRSGVSTAKKKRLALVTSQEFHRRCFAKWGNKCYFCGGPATDAMHIKSRWLLGPHRYACPEENSRPGCRRCHDLNTTHQLFFDRKDEINAIRALNKVLTAKLREPA